MIKLERVTSKVFSVRPNTWTEMHKHVLTPVSYDLEDFVKYPVLFVFSIASALFIHSWRNRT